MVTTSWLIVVFGEAGLAQRASRLRGGLDEV
jgi:hypothetical protein